MSKKYEKYYDPYAEERPGPEIRKGILIRVQSYDVKSQTFSIKVPAEEAVAALPVLPEDLAKNIDGFDLEKLKKSPKSVLGKEFYVFEGLPTMGIKAFDDRLKKFSPESRNNSAKKAAKNSTKIEVKRKKVKRKRVKRKVQSYLKKRPSKKTRSKKFANRLAD